MMISIFSLLASTAILVFANGQSNVKLEFVQAMWRHGERASQVDQYPIYEKDWIYGGGGLGELTAIGMGEMNELGWLIRKRYVTKLKFLTPKYASREVYFRSTNFNRTIISAQSLLYGLFPPSLYDVKNVDYPYSPLTWFPGFTFVPVHVDGPDQCAASQNCPCTRYDLLQGQMLTLPEVLPKYTQVVLLNRRVGGYYNMTSGLDSFTTYPDTWKCQRAYFNRTMYAKLPWYNEELYYQAQVTYAPVKGFLEGNFENPAVTSSGLDVGLEIKKVRSGVIINEVFNRANEKLNCAELGQNCTSYLNKLKFYGYSIHDNNVYGVLVALGIPQIANTLDGWPAYAAGIFMEFHRNTSTNERFFKVLYREGDDTPISDVTSQLPICNGATLCPLGALQTLAETLKPLPDITTLCKTPL
ncbi:Putative acid phosphatase 11 [Caenorhabditis elegans]|uniref:Putative acid phosphatase 11 n=1 Tax=Caenorhabditis elegans TaxID=6239 RepID=PHO11_CAEEL|nr:Putative acid phosphatase 11 [Caenorhabditis elegans]Q09451.2 RecName: Full=Putative acid phosphatase 11 [Caenorhabditis elegans]CAA88205.1 Putative acid phosphatase 11 [Caenorhabditis elegans]|eukprot:NP_496143.1 Putative acid phosphatase 11 [Caenorhabditis elegans]